MYRAYLSKKDNSPPFVCPVFLTSKIGIETEQQYTQAGNTCSSYLGCELSYLKKKWRAWIVILLCVFVFHLFKMPLLTCLL